MTQKVISACYFYPP
jgi:hypothetical protein